MKHGIIAVIALLIIGGGWWYMNQGTTATPVVENMDAAGTVLEGSGVEPNDTPGMTADSGAVKEFVVTATNFSFDVSTMSVKKGDRVRIVFKNSTGQHDWVVDEFSARTKVTNGGESETIEFVADKAGSFEYYCSVGKHRQMGMKGTLTVSE
ncbi:MAG: cupredoxin domain-containing protein [Patescibacteria group bacterium]